MRAVLTERKTPLAAETAGYQPDTDIFLYTLSDFFWPDYFLLIPLALTGFLKEKCPFNATTSQP
jgi:hypothetical protein